MKAAPRRTAKQHRIAQHSSHARAQGIARSTDPHSTAPIPTDPKRSPQVIIAAPRRESQQQSKAAPRRAGQSHGGVARRAGGASVEGHPKTHSPRHGHHPHLPIAVNERAHLEFCERRRVPWRGSHYTTVHHFTCLLCMIVYFTRYVRLIDENVCLAFDPFASRCSRIYVSM